MTIPQQEHTTFDERLLGELRRLISARDLAEATAPQRRASRAWRRALAISAPLVVAAAVSMAILLPGSSPPAFAIGRSPDGTVTVAINSFQNPAGLEHGLSNAGIPTIVLLLPPGKDCSAPQTWMPVPMGNFPVRLANPRAPAAIDTGGVAHAALTLILRYIPTHATLVIESMRSPGLRPDNPTGTYALAISPGNARGIRIFWARGQVKPCTVVDTSLAH